MQSQSLNCIWTVKGSFSPIEIGLYFLLLPLWKRLLDIGEVWPHIKCILKGKSFLRDKTRLQIANWSAKIQRKYEHFYCNWDLFFFMVVIILIWHHHERFSAKNNNFCHWNQDFFVGMHKHWTAEKVCKNYKNINIDFLLS